jgi:hypothetical protein
VAVVGPGGIFAWDRRRFIAAHPSSTSRWEGAESKREGRFGLPFCYFDADVRLDNRDVLSLPALGTLGHRELNALAFLEAAEAL